ncbi:MAG TPA: hypothetical protein VH062_04235 [Polyangiaceae bacterium]|jgi:hypothetical protein|nr:hypothetical protein [Polyangiaceae bacterium]
MPPVVVFDGLLSLIQVAVTIVAFRLLPFALYAALRMDGLPRSQVIVLMGLFVSAASATYLVNPGGMLPLLSSTMALGYFACVGVAFHYVRRSRPADFGRQAAVFLLAVTCYFAVPALAMPRWIAPLILLEGWELIFSSYSYAVDSPEIESSLGEGLFFLLVNPVLVFPMRGSAVPPGEQARLPRAVGRVLQGAIVICAQGAVLSILSYCYARGLLLKNLSEVDGAATYARFIAYYVGQCLSLYAVHAGVASIEIGCMAVLGYRIPERYAYPFAAATPLEFWSRWNTYLGDWLRRHVFFPVVMSFRRRRSKATPATVMGVLAVFATIGILHAAVPLASQARAGSASFVALTLVFVVHGTALLVWEAIRRATRERFARVGMDPRLRGVTLLGSWVLLRHLNAILAWVAIPVMARGTLPPELSRIW